MQDRNYDPLSGTFENFRGGIVLKGGDVQDVSNEAGEGDGIWS